MRIPLPRVMARRSVRYRITNPDRSAIHDGVSSMPSATSSSRSTGLHEPLHEHGIAWSGFAARAAGLPNVNPLSTPGVPARLCPAVLLLGDRQAQDLPLVRRARHPPVRRPQGQRLDPTAVRQSVEVLAQHQIASVAAFSLGAVPRRAAANVDALLCETFRVVVAAFGRVVDTAAWIRPRGRRWTWPPGHPRCGCRNCSTAPRPGPGTRTQVQPGTADVPSPRPRLLSPDSRLSATPGGA